MPDRVVIQWDKDDCADMGLVKVDLLGLGMMAVLQDALELVNSHRAVRAPRSGVRKDRADSSVAADPSQDPIVRTRIADCGPGSPDPSATADPEPRAVDLAHLPPDDPAVYRMLQEADTVGIFQVESRAQMATLPRLRPERFYDIVVEVAIIRPGPIVGQMVHPYLKRRQGRRAGGVSASVAASRSWRGRSACRCSRSSCCGWRWWRRDFPAARPRSCGARSGSSDPRSACSRSKASCAPGWTRQGITGDGGGRDHPVDHLVRALRISRVARRQLRAAGLRQRVSEGALPGGVLHRDAEQPADGVLPSGDAGQGCAAPRRPLRADRRAGVRLGMPRRAGRPRAAGADVCERACAQEIGPRDRRGRDAAVRGARSAVRGSATDQHEAEFERQPDRCPKCGCDDQSMLEETPEGRRLLQHLRA